ncbi:MAG: Ig-like domain repeat protein, partial [Terracidiphilus sp.]
GSNAYLNGVGNGPAVSMISSAATQPIANAASLSEPLQVAADSLGNSYVADSTLKEIEYYPAGSSSVTGVNIGSNLTAPTGVAVDGVGNVFIGDSGSVYEVPIVKGKWAASQQTALMSGLGNHLNLAADASGDVFVADKDNKQVVEIPNPQTSLLLTAEPTLVLAPDAGFKGPSAIATDSQGNVWVADGSNLWEIGMPLGVPSEAIVGGLSAPVTGLAVDPSGSVFVAGANGVTWIPYSATTGSLNVSSKVQVLTGLGTTNAETPNSIALDGFENLYATFGSSAANAGLTQIGIGGTLNFDQFGEVNPNVPFEGDAQIFNIGNLGLTFDAFAQSESLENAAGTYVFSGADAADFLALQATENSPACGPTTVTAPGSFCYLGLLLTSPTATYPAQATGSVAAMSNAVNAPSGINIAMSGTVIQDLRWASTTTVTVTPASTKACGTSTGSVYPGCQTVTVVVAPNSADASTVGTPSGTVIVSVGSASGSLPKQTLTLDGTGTATYTYPALQGGSYTVNALYGGEGTAGATQNTCSGGTPCFAGSAGSGSFTITPATPAFVVGVPVTAPNCLNATTGSNGSPSSNCAPIPDDLTVWAGNTYVLSQAPSWIYVSVQSTVGTPTGTVSFLVPSAKGVLVPADPKQGINGKIPLNGNGIAAFSLAGLANGVYNLTVQYNGDTNYAVAATSGSSNVLFEIINSVAQICVGCTASTAHPAALSLTAGTPASVNLTLMPLVGFGVNVSLQCVNLPANSECTFLYPNSTNGTITVGSNVPSTLALTISTNVPVNGTTVTSIERKTPWSLAGLLGLGLAGLIAGRKKFNRYVTMICLAVMFAGASMGVTACTNAGYSTPLKVQATPTPPGTYQVGVISYNPAIGPSQPDSLTTPPFTMAVTVQ